MNRKIIKKYAPKNTIIKCLESFGNGIISEIYFYVHFGKKKRCKLTTYFIFLQVKKKILLKIFKPIATAKRIKDAGNGFWIDKSN